MTLTGSSVRCQDDAGHSPKWKIVSLCVAATCLYGVIHDQITIRISPEYFTLAHPAFFPTSNRTLLALCWGIAATWWIGAAFGLGGRRGGPARGASGTRIPSATRRAISLPFRDHRAVCDSRRRCGLPGFPPFDGCTTCRADGSRPAFESRSVRGCVVRPHRKLRRRQHWWCAAAPAALARARPPCCSPAVSARQGRGRACGCSFGLRAGVDLLAGEWRLTLPRRELELGLLLVLRELQIGAEV